MIMISKALLIKCVLWGHSSTCPLQILLELSLLLTFLSVWWDASVYTAQSCGNNSIHWLGLYLYL